MGMIAIAVEAMAMHITPIAVFKELTMLTSPGILNERTIPFSLTVLSPAMANKESWDPMVLITPNAEHFKVP